MANNRINFQVGFSVDKSGLSEMQSLFQQIVNKAKEPGKEMNTGLQQAAKTASTLDSILEKTFNTSLGSLNVTKFNQELVKSGITLKDIKNDFSQVGSQGTIAYNRLSQAILGTNLQLKESNKLLDSMATTMANTVKWGITSSIFNTITNSIQKAYTYSKQLDTSLNDIRIVTNKSADDMANFAEKANDAAKALGASTLDYSNASLIYYQQGLSDAEVAARAETTVKAANVTGQTGEEVSEQLTAVWNGYKVTAEETEAYVDKLAAVAATTAADLEELSKGMSKVAAAANAMGVDFDDLNAQIATIVSVTRQAPESVGTALKTIYARLGDLKVDGVDEFGVSLGEVSGQMQTMGIQILDQQGNLRDMSSVIAEVAQKWGTWTEAQKQAAAVAMAGKRQYNNLIALFENWGMYTDALNTSQEALGTLQQQQDIYMESTVAKLKTLKATWQDLYGDLINEDELNTGIEALTDLVQVFDNFIESFGGGIKSITAFGTIVANIFNKQIANAINEAIQQQNIYKQNIEALQSKAAAIQSGTLANTGNEIVDRATTENTKVQLEYAEQIYAVRKGLTTEQYNELTAIQEKLGSLAEEKILLEQQITLEDKRLLGEKQIQAILNDEFSKAEQVADQYSAQVNKLDEVLDKHNQKKKNIEEEFNAIKNIVTTGKEESEITKEIESHLQSIRTTSRNIDADFGKQVVSLFKTVKNAENYKEVQVNIRKVKDEIIKSLDKILEKEIQSYNNENKKLEAAEKVLDIRRQQEGIKEEEFNYQQKASNMIAVANANKNVAQSVIGVTSVVGNLAMTWGSLNSLIDVWQDKTISAGSKISQTLMTLGMTLPMLYSNFSKISDTFMTANASLNILTKSLEVDTLKQVANNLVKIQSGEITDENTIKQTANTISKELDITVTGEKIIADGAEITQQELLNKILEKQILLRGEILKTKLAGFFQSSAGVALIAVTAVAALAAAIYAYSKAQRSAAEAEIEANKEQINRINQLQQESEETEKLYDSYMNLYEQYKQGKISKEELYDVTNQLCEEYDLENGYLAKLTGNYEDFTDSVRKARKEQLELLKADTKREETLAQKNVVDTGIASNKGLFNNQYNVKGNEYTVNLKGDNTGIKTNIEKKAEDIIDKYVTQTVNKNDTNAIIKQYHQIESAVEEMNRVMSDSERKTSTEYERATRYLEEEREAIEELEASKEDLINVDTQLVANEINFAGATDIDDFLTKTQEFKKQLIKTIGIDNFSDDIITKYLQTLDNDYVQIALGLQELKKQVDDSADEFIDNLTAGQKEYLLSGKVDLKFVQTKEDIERELQNSFDNYGTFDVSASTSLANTLISGTKLKKKDNQAISDLESDVPSAMAGFDDKSVLHQLEAIDEVNNYRIQKNQEYLQNFEEVTQKKIELLNQEKQHIQENAEYQNLLAAQQRRDLTDSEEETLNYYKNLEKEAGEAINNLHLKLAEGLDFKEIEDTGFDSLISGIDMVANRAETLQNAAELIGEGFTVAAKDVEKFSAIFPELLENYQVLSDGSLQLDQDVVKQHIEGIQAEMEARTEAKIAEVDQQIALKELEQEYLQEKLKNLELYLQGKQDEQATIDAINKAGQEYESALNAILGEENRQLTQQAIANANTEGQALINMLNSVGAGFAQAAKAHYAMINGQDFDWKSINFNGTAGSAQEYAANSGKQAQAAYERASDTYEQIYAEAQKTQEQLNTVKGELDQLNKAKAVLQSTGKAASHALGNVAAGKAGKDAKDKKGGGGKDKKDKDEKEYRDEFDRYWELNKAIEATDKAMKKLEKDQKNLFGYQLIDSLKKTNKLLDAQAANYEKLAEAQQAEAAELRNQLGTMGVMFDASGAIVNYAEATAQALAAYNAAIQKYNAGLIDETTLGVAEKAYENFKKLLERYDTLYYKEIEDTKEKLDDIRREKLANNLKAWEVEVDLKLNWKELKRGWNDFLKEIKEDFKSVYKDLRVETKNMAKDAKTYIGADGSIGVTIKAIKDVTKEIDKMMAGKDSKMFESVSQAQEKLKELNETLQDNAKALHDLMEQAWKEYLDGIDQVADKFDDLMDRFQKINDELEFQGQLIELLYGEKAYGLLDALYKGQEKSLGNQVQSVKQQVDMWKELFEESGASMDNQADWTEDQKKYYDEWMEAQEKLNDLVIDYIKLLKTDYLNTIDKVLSELEKAITGSSLKDVSTEWERISAYADKYLDDVEQAYETQKFANKINEQIAKTDSLKNQQKLQAFREKEIKYLREKENLTQYDLDAAEARYQIALKEMALEDARNNKTSMKLVRNDQGNWSYQYMADEEDVQSKQQELLDAYNNLYQLASNAYESNLESLQELQEKYLESAKEIYTDETLTEEEKQQKLLELRTWYFEQYRLLAEENTLYRNDLATSASALLLEIYNQDKEAYETMTTEEQELLNNLIEANIEDYMDLEEKIKENYKNIDDSSKTMMANTRADWTSTAQLLADLWNKDAGGSVRYEVVDAHKQIIKATEDYKAKVDWLANAVERNFGEKGIKGAIDKASEATDRLKDKTEDLVNDGVNYLDDLRRAVEEIEDAWNSVADAIENAIDLLEEYLQKKAEAAAADAATGSAGGGGGSGSSGGSSGSGGSGSGGSGSGGSGGATKWQVELQHGGDKRSWIFYNKAEAEAYAKKMKNMGPDYGVRIISFDAGGYTGAWNGGDTDGRMAMLHQKELVLNKTDTANFLEGINTLRDMTGLNGSISSAITQAVANMALALGKTKANNLNGTTINETTQNEGNTFTIYADFPNADNVNDIREALMSLPNLASQYVARNGK